MAVTKATATFTNSTGDYTYTATAVDGNKPPTVKHPGFSSRLRSGRPLAVMPWKRTFLKYSPGSVSVNGTAYDRYWRQVGSTAKGSGAVDFPSCAFNTTLTSDPAPFSPNETALINQAVARANMGGWDVGTFAAEAKKSLALLASVSDQAVKRAGKIANALGAGRPGKGGQQLTYKDFTDAWLEANFGWRPLMSDLRDLLDLVNSLQESEERIGKLFRSVSNESRSLDRVITSASSSAWIPNGNSCSTWYLPGLDITRIDTISNIDEVRVGAGVWAWTGLGDIAVNPFATAWEIVPWSWLIDYFVPIGDTIAASTPTFGRKLEYVWMTRKSTRVFTRQSMFEPKTSGTLRGVSWGGGSVSHTIESVIYDRQIVGFTPFQFTVNPSLNLNKFLNAGSALLNKDSNIRNVVRI